MKYSYEDDLSLLDKKIKENNDKYQTEYGKASATNREVNDIIEDWKQWTPQTHDVHGIKINRDGKKSSFYYDKDSGLLIFE